MIVTCLNKRRGGHVGGAIAASLIPSAPLVGAALSSITLLYAKTGAGNWSDPAAWSATGKSGTDSSGPPDATYDVIVDSGATAPTVDAHSSCRSLDFTSGPSGQYLGTFFHNTGCELAIGGTIPGPGNVALKLGAGVSYIPAGSTSLVSFGGSAASQSITTAGKTISSLTFNGSGSWTLQDNLTVTNFLIISGGTLTTNNRAISCTGFSASGGTTNLGSSVINLTRTSSGNVVTVTAPAAINAGTSEFVVANTSTSARTFAGGGRTFYKLTYTVAGSTGGLVITGANTFDTISFSDTSNARTLTLPASATTTVSAFNVNGTAGKLMSVISSASGTAATISRGPGSVSCDYLSLKDSTATGGAIFYAGANSTNVSGNTGWLFTSGTLSSGAYSVVGSNATLKYGRVTPATSGTYSISGTNAVLAHGSKVAAGSGTYTITGSSATLIYSGASKSIFANPGTYAITGSNQTLRYGRVFPAAPSSYTISGTNATLRVGRRLSAGSGTYAITGTQATLTVSALVGFYIISGTDAVLRKGFALRPAPGAYAYTGTNASLKASRRLVAGSGVYSITGTDTTTSHRDYVLSADAGTYAISGTDASLQYGFIPSDLVYGEFQIRRSVSDTVER